MIVLCLIAGTSVSIAADYGPGPQIQTDPRSGTVVATSSTWKQSPLLDQIDRARARTHRCERELSLRRTPVSQEPISGNRYAGWVLRLWTERARVTCSLVRVLRDPRAAILAVFGPVYGPGAIVVATCEGGLRPNAENGQYRGTFQMGSSERARFGHSSSVLGQARAAYRYFVASGRDWSPWQCRPNGGLGWN